MTRLFVYGTLRTGMPNHGQVASARLVGLVRTRPSYTLFDLDDYPGMARGGRTAVVGELYEVDDALLAELDSFEGHPHLFTRESVALEDGAAQAYFLGPYAGREHPTIYSGDWAKHVAARA